MERSKAPPPRGVKIVCVCVCVSERALWHFLDPLIWRRSTLKILECVCVCVRTHRFLVVFFLEDFISSWPSQSQKGKRKKVPLLCDQLRGSDRLHWIVWDEHFTPPPPPPPLPVSLLWLADRQRKSWFMHLFVCKEIQTSEDQIKRLTLFNFK